MAVRYYADEYDTIRLKILSIAEGLENLKMDIDTFIYYFEDRAENADNMKKTYKMLLNKMKLKLLCNLNLVMESNGNCIIRYMWSVKCYGGYKSPDLRCI